MKKRVISILTAVSCSLSMLGIMPELNAHAEEIVSNDFETSYGGWYELGDSVCLRSEAGIGIGGSKGMKVTGRQSPENGAESDKHFYLTGGVKYDYSVQVMSGTDETFRFCLRYTRSGKTYTEILAEKSVKGGEWTALSATYKAPENADNLTLNITTDSASDFVFDDVSVTEKRSGNTAYAADAKGLKDEFAGYFRVGNTLNGTTVKNSSITNNVLKDFNSITCPNETKPDYTLVQSTSKGNTVGVTLKSCAAIMDFCANHNIPMRGHTFVWHAQTPTWFFKKDYNANNGWVDEATMDARLESYISGMFAAIKQQYPTLNLYAYDVANECIANTDRLFNVNGGAREPGDDKKESGKSAWVQIYKDNHYVQKAFEIAKKYRPQGCALCYNDYNEYWDGKQNAMYNLCKSLYDKGLLDAVGMQSHVNAGATGFGGTDAYIKAMKRFLSIGCDVQVTELDINLKSNTYSEQEQANKYKAIFQTAMEWNQAHPTSNRVTAICMWGMNDSLSWIGASNKPLLYDANNQPKLAYKTLIGMIPESEWGNGAALSTVTLPDENGYYFTDSFDGQNGGWNARGAASIQNSSDEHFAGSGALYIGNREKSWNGAEKQLSAGIYEGGKAYSFSVNVKNTGESDNQTFYLKLQYKDADDETHYDTIAEGVAVSGLWTQLCNTAYTLPEGASNLKLYVETKEGTDSFYLDEAACAVGGTLIEGAGQPEYTIKGDVNADKAFDPADVIVLQKWLLTYSDAALADWKAGDLNADGRLDAIDLTLMKHALLAP